MTLPRRIVPGSFQLLTRRCTQRMFLLTPDDRTNEIVNYCLAEAAARFDITLIAWLMMSNHYHAVVYDPNCRHPEFTEHFHKLVAKAMNQHRERSENFWSNAETCVTLLPTIEDVLNKVVYVLTNPVKAHLVDSVSDWPGVSSWSYMLDEPKTKARPKGGFFRESKAPIERARGRRQGTRRVRKVPLERMPRFAKLRAAAPPSINGEPPMSMETWRKRVRAAVAEKEKGLVAARIAAKIPLVTRAVVLKQDPFHSPSGVEGKWKIQPALACRDKGLRRIEHAKLEFFRVQYERILGLFVAGDHSVYFPHGTYFDALEN